MNFEKEIENGLVKVSDKTGYYNNNISRESYWENNFPEYKEQFFETYREWRDMFDSEPQVSFFIKCYFFDKNPRSLGLYRRFKDIKDYFENATHSELISKHYHSYFKDEFKDIVDFETDNIYEVKMCFDNGIRERPTSRVSSFLQFFDDFELKFCVFLKNANDVEYEFKKHFKEKRVLFESSFDGHTEYLKLNNDDLEYIKRVLYENQ